MMEAAGQSHGLSVTAVVAPLGLLGVGQGQPNALLQGLGRVLEEHTDSVLAEADRLSSLDRISIGSVVRQSCLIDSADTLSTANRGQGRWRLGPGTGAA